MAGIAITKCGKCGEELQATSLFFNRTPGYSCKCEWGTLTPHEFRQTFGFSFSSFKRKIDQQPKSYFFIKSQHIGSSHQRRTQRRREIRLLKENK